VKVLFLYTELARYTVACFRKLVDCGAKLLVLRYQINPEAPFVFEDTPGITYLNYDSSDNEKLKGIIFDFSPDLVFCSGWKNTFYVRIAKIYFSKKIPVVLCFDNKWEGSFRQYLGIFYYRIYFSGCFSHAWVPGARQREFALRLGFKSVNIQTDFYSADSDYFNKIYDDRKDIGNTEFPKRFIFIGRYLSLKGIEDLWKSFFIFSEKFPDWELWCFGTGEILPVQHPKIKHFGFMQPEDLYSFLLPGGVFILPSRIEPWGVIVHEMACAGFPLLLSDEVGASDLFLSHNKNGYLFKANNVQSCIAEMANIAKLTSSQLFQMAKISNRKASCISPDKWAVNALSFKNM
jgi:glycosyltransferase involved in cell wall biosynthesis